MSEKSLKAPRAELTRPAFDTYGMVKKHEFFFLSPHEQQPVEGAAVIVFRSSDDWTTYEVGNAVTDEKGCIEVTQKLGVERLLLHAFKPDVGWGTEQFSGTNPQWRIVFQRPQPLKIFCTSRTGNLRGNSQLTLVAEMRWPAGSEGKWLKFPARRVSTDEFGRCLVEGLPPWQSRLEIKATWEGYSTTVRLDDYPKEEVRILID